MSLLRIVILMLMSIACISTSYSYAETKPSAPTRKVHAQTSKKRKPAAQKQATKKSAPARKKSQPVKNKPQVTTAAPAPARPPTPGITAATPAQVTPDRPMPNVVPKVTPSLPAPIATPTPTQKPAPTPQVVQKGALQKGSAPKEQRLIVLDPGHGGYDLGARMSACDEKSLALSTALLAKKYLTEMGYRVILTRSRDVFMPLEKRTLIANETKSKLFVSIHYNAAKNTIAKGVEVFYYASADKFRTGSSKMLAARVLSKVIDRTVAESRGVKEGNFHVIRETKMPAILIEAGFMTNPDELHLLKDINYRDKIARGIAEGIDSFFKV